MSLQFSNSQSSVQDYEMYQSAIAVHSFVIKFYSLKKRLNHQFLPHKQHGVMLLLGRSQWPCGLMLGSAAVRLLGSRVQIPPGAWMSVSFECCVLEMEVSATDRSLVQRSPNECGVSECNREASTMRGPWPTTECCAVK
jgi:hypothetical protein